MTRSNEVLRRLALAGVLAILPGLAGCGFGTTDGDGPITSLASLVEHKGTMPTAPLISSKLGGQIAHDSSAPVRKFALRSTPSLNASINVASKLGWVREPGAESYLNGLLHRLAHGLPKPLSTGAIFIGAGPQFQAMATSDGEIVVNIGVLHQAQSEAEIAAILAHELAHIALHHFTLEPQRRSLLSAVNIATGGAVIAAYASELRFNRVGKETQITFADGTGQEAAGSAFKALSISLAARTAIDDLSAGHLSREQEFEADLLGVDILARAGYPPSAMLRMLDIMVAEEKKEEATKKLLSERFGEQASQSLGKSAFKFLASGGDMSEVTQQMGSDLLSFTGSEIVTAYKDDHPSARARRELVSSYIEAFHGNSTASDPDNRAFKAALHSKRMTAVRTSYERFFEAQMMLAEDRPEDALRTANAGLTGPMKSNAAGSFIAYRALIMLNQREQGYRILTAAKPGNEAPPTFYTALAEEHATRGKTLEAISALDKAEALYESQDLIYPSRIKVYKSLRDGASMGKVLLACNGRPMQEIRNACNKAANEGDATIQAGREGEGIGSNASTGMDTIIRGFRNNPLMPF